MPRDSSPPPKALILASGAGVHARRLTGHSRPPCLLTVGGSTVIERLIRTCLSCGLSQFVVVVGHGAEEITEFINKAFRGIRVSYVAHADYQDTNTGHALMVARTSLGQGAFLKFPADILFDADMLRRLLDSKHDTVLCMDRAASAQKQQVRVVTNDDLSIQDMGKSVKTRESSGTLLGIDKIGPHAAQRLFEDLTHAMAGNGHRKETCEAAYERLIDNAVPFHALDVVGQNWARVQTDDDVAAATLLFEKPVTTVSRSQQKLIDEALESAA